MTDTANAAKNAPQNASETLQDSGMKDEAEKGTGNAAVYIEEDDGASTDAGETRIGTHERLKPGLYVVATPIGRLGEMSPRALHVLRGCNRVLCEDTRVTGKLLSAFGIKNRLYPYHDHSDSDDRSKILHWIEDGECIALVSDAGTPLISDPGYKLVDHIRTSGLNVWAVSGPSALTASLSVAGLPTDHFYFAGFAPTKSGKRTGLLKDLKTVAGTLVFYENPKRLADFFADALEALGDRPAAVCREMTTKLEEVVRGNISDLLERYTAGAEQRGEAVVLIGPAKEEGPANTATATIAVSHLLESLVAEVGVKKAAQVCSDLTGQNKKGLYQQAIKLKG